MNYKATHTVKLYQPLRFRDVYFSAFWNNSTSRRSTTSFLDKSPTSCELYAAAPYHTNCCHLVTFIFDLFEIIVVGIGDFRSSRNKPKIRKQRYYVIFGCTKRNKKLGKSNKEDNIAILNNKGNI